MTSPPPSEPGPVLPTGPASVAADGSQTLESHSVVFGGAGFVGTNVCDRLLSEGRRVTLFDAFSRPGVQRNAAFLKQRYGRRLRIIHSDIRDRAAVDAAVMGATDVFHFAAQVAVTTSLDDPRADFEINALGTLNILEAVRRQAPAARVLFTSTNKVYGDLNGLPLREAGTRYEPAGDRLAVAEAALDFHSPYGCSKGCADQYVLDYGRTYGLNTVVFRMSCIYGPHQHGNADQGWVAHFVRRALRRQPVTIYGNGKQVRDVLYVGDLVDAMMAVMKRPEPLRAAAFNVGGGVHHTLSLLELCDELERQIGEPMDLRFDLERIGDQRYYVSDTRALEAAIGWRPHTPPAVGLSELAAWVRSEPQAHQDAAWLPQTDAAELAVPA